MADPFEYDVFLSFSSADEQIVKPIWQDLTSNGLRVFWSDATLKKEVGNSWLEVIERSLERSRHMLLICSDNSMTSKWVQREYRAFFDQFCSSDTRRLIPLLTHGFQPNSLPLFLRGLQVERIDNPHFIQELIPLLGGVNIAKLQEENQHLQEKVITLNAEIQSYKTSLAHTTKTLELRDLENKKLEEAVTMLKAKIELLRQQVDNPGERMETQKLSAKPVRRKIQNSVEENHLPETHLQEEAKKQQSPPEGPNSASVVLWDTLHERINGLKPSVTS